MTPPLTLLTKASVDPNLIRQFERWFRELRAAGVYEQDATSMTLATAAKDGQPRARIVLLKSFDESGFLVFTNYLSRKDGDLTANAHACLLYYWPPLWRQ